MVVLCVAACFHIAEGRLFYAEEVKNEYFNL